MTKPTCLRRCESKKCVNYMEWEYELLKKKTKLIKFTRQIGNNIL